MGHTAEKSTFKPSWCLRTAGSVPWDYPCICSHFKGKQRRWTGSFYAPDQPRTSLKSNRKTNIPTGILLQFFSFSPSRNIFYYSSKGPLKLPPLFPEWKKKTRHRWFCNASSFHLQEQNLPAHEKK